ncbi:MAG: tRNA-dihydrouridine synthase family protein [Eubacteriales bacterium]|nr:tRNA-dihydrouridine synthase family protein [Eubacteriales bacterium]
MHLYLAPMEGITTHIYRNAFAKYYGGITRYYTPFLSNKVLSTKEIRDIDPANNKDIPLVPQILTNQADTFAEIANVLKEYGYTEVNLNLGCPSGTVVAKKRGAGFLDIPDQLDRFLDTIYTSCEIDISIKTRIGIDSEWEWEDLLAIYKKYPIKELIIHPRYQKEFYKGTPHVDAYKQAIDILSDTNIPLCYNGDIYSIDTYHNFLKAVPDTSAIMIGRGAIANPNLPNILTQTSYEQNATEKYTTLRLFHDELLSGYLSYMSGEQPALFKMKELWAYMGTGFSVSEKLLKKVRKANRLADYQSVVQTIWTSFSSDYDN